ncbi:hypothetical protein GF338_05915, partial [candidate division WOR-3 bacterium]|nr:hypothetical protein [candidate division WOR-3 bacterium]
MKKYVILSVFSVLFFSGCAEHRQRETEQMSFPAKYYKNIKIETSNGEILSQALTDADVITVKLTKWATGYTVQDAKLNLGKIDVRVREDTSDSMLRIYVDAPTRTILCGCEVELQLPESIYANLITSNGNVSAQGHKEGLRLRSKNGEIYVNGTAGKLNVVTSNGKLRLVNHLGDIYAKTSNGGLELSRTVGEADIETSNGTISVQGHTGNIEGNTSNGKVEASVVIDKEEGKCRFFSSNGSVSVA